MSDEPLLELNNLWKVFDHRGRRLEVLCGLDLKVFQGDRIAIMGPSGAGKSTLLQLMGTLDEPTEGQLYFRGDEQFSRSSSELAAFRNKRIGFVFQFHHLLPEFTAVENAMMPGLIARQSRTEAYDRAVELLDEVGLGERIEHQPGELSGGEQHRVALARALFMEPDILLADELTGNLDLKTGAEIHEVLRRINEKTGITVVVVTHDPRLAQKMPVKLVLEKGKLVPYEPNDERVRKRIPSDVFERVEETSDLMGKQMEGRLHH